jgi:hypothetical protein
VWNSKKFPRYFYRCRYLLKASGIRVENTHTVDNSNTENYESEIQQGTDGHICTLQILDTSATEHLLNYFIFDPVYFAETADSTQRDCTASRGLLIVVEHGPGWPLVFLVTYIAKAISGINNQLYQDEDSDDAGLVVSSRRGLAQRTRLDSVITRPVDKRWLPLAPVNGPVQGHGESDRDPLHFYQPWFNVFYNMV